MQRDVRQRTSGINADPESHGGPRISRYLVPWLDEKTAGATSPHPANDKFRNVFGDADRKRFHL